MAQYDLALSFANEDRSYVSMVADFLKVQGVSIFYDEYNKVDLWGKDLYDHLIKVYRDEASYVVMFISSHYKDKVWCNHERRAAQARALRERREYILPARFDDTQLEGLNETIGYLDLRKLSPRDFAVLICEKIGKPILLQKANRVPSPASPTDIGEVTFNYSNNDGRFRIGTPPHDFETAWSKASKEMIYCYNDPPSIRGVALAQKGEKLSSITDAASYDFSSRCRSPEIDQIVLLQNCKGFYAALHILEIKDDSRGDPQDELTFQYWILTDGSSDFSKLKE